MIGLIPKSTFLTWMRNKQANKGGLTLAQTKAEVQDRRLAMLYLFSKTDKNSTNLSDSLSEARTSVLLNQSSVDDDDDCVQDMEAVNCHFLIARYSFV